jgi:hypothetical protein
MRRNAALQGAGLATCHENNETNEAAILTSTKTVGLSRLAPWFCPWSQTEVPPTLVPIKHLVTESSTVAQLLFALVMTYPAGCVAFGGDSKRSNLGGCDGKSESGSEESCNNEEAQRNG